MEIELSPQALEDLSSIALYIAADSSVRALTFTDELEEKALACGIRPIKVQTEAMCLPV